MTNNIVILAAKRTPTGNFNGQFVKISAPELAAATIASNLNSISLDASTVDGVNLGCVLPAGLGQAPARQAALSAGLSVHTPCTTLNKMCGSGMQSVIMAHDALIAGSHQLMVAGGMENMSRAPFLLVGARQGYRLGHQQVLDHLLYDGLEDAYEKGRHMGYFAEMCAEKYNITREDQDAFALASVHKARRAIESGFFKSEIAAVDGIEQDQGPFSINPEKIPNLKPVFKPDGTITAANASSLADGAASLILTTETLANKMDISWLATIKGHFTYADEPAWFTTAPIKAIQGLLNKMNWKLGEVDLFEINEAFAVVSLVTIQALKINPEQVNVHGGGCILGHPIGATGTRIIVTLIHALRQRRLRRGIAALCIGGGEATAIAIEVPDLL